MPRSSTSRPLHRGLGMDKKRVTKPQSSVSMPRLRDFSVATVRAAELGPDRLTLGQFVFFLYAGMADLSGRPATFSEIQEAAGERINKSMHTTYKVLLDGMRRSDRVNTPGVGWLYRETDSTDNRRKLLKLTPKGLSILEAITAEGKLK